MRICYVGEVGATMAGSQQSLISIMIEMKRLGVEPYFVTHREWEMVRVVEKYGIPAKVIVAQNFAIPKGQVNKFTWLRVLKRKIYNLTKLKEMKKYLKENNIDLVHINSVLACNMWAKAAQKCKIPYVWHIREYMDEDHNRILYNKREIYKQLKKANDVIAISNSIKKVWERRIGRECTLVYNGLSKEKYYFENHHLFNNNIVNFLIVGRIVEGKGQKDAVVALKHLVENGINNINLTIVGYRGNDLYEIDLKKYVNDNGLNSYIKFVDYTYDISQYSKNCDIGLICSKAEAFGRITVEYMLSGMAVIGSNTGGTVEIIEDGVTGILYNQKSIVSLEEAMKYAIMHKEKMKEIALNGQNKAIENFLIDNTVNSCKEIYNYVLSEI